MELVYVRVFVACCPLYVCEKTKLKLRLSGKSNEYLGKRLSWKNVYVRKTKLEKINICMIFVFVYMLIWAEMAFCINNKVSSIISLC